MIKQFRNSLIEANNISLSIPIIKPNNRSLSTDPFRLLGSLYLSRANRSKAILLNDVSFTLKQGERLGLIGSNGAGKTTLLRILSGIYRPSKGNLTINGEIKGLFDKSLGMRPDATGLENIYLRGLRMDLSLKEIKILIPEVIEFSELFNHINKPLSTFSSGMRLRLAIAISTMIEPDILLLDEWIGVGDSKFNSKVKKRMIKLVDQSRGLVLATHNTTLMQSICTHGLVIDSGHTVFHGGIDEALYFYNNKKDI